jgi:hemoglobin
VAELSDLPLRPVNIYESVGGMETFRRIVDSFYEGVEADPVLRPMYPESLDKSRERLALFLAQFFGGPQTYSDSRGHPRLRKRHVPFSIGQAERDAWMRHMTAAIDVAGISEPSRKVMLDYFEDAATFLINQVEG